jgi:hypothetical protein
MSNIGNNDYNSQKLIPTETIVSRTLQAKNRFWTNIIWRTGKPALDSEWNLMNDTSMEMICNLTRSITPSGWTDLGENVYSSGNSGIANVIQFYSNKKQQILDIPNVVVNGWPIIVGGVNFTDTSINSVTLPVASTGAAEYRYDFVFLEVWRTQVRSRDENNDDLDAARGHKPDTTHIYAYGNTQFGGTNFDDDLVDTTIRPPDGIETSERVQIQYRIRTVQGVTFSNLLSSGFESINVQGQGGNVNSQISGYQFINMKTELNDAGLWRTGNGDEASQVALRTVDGYSYAIPMFKVFRRTTIAYSDTGATPTDAYNNQQGNSSSLSTSISDRPDDKFYDGIDYTDIVDLRLKATINSLDYNQILEKNLDLLLRGELNSVRNITNQYDSISDSSVNGYTDFRSSEGSHGKRIIWTDAANDQLDLFSRLEIGMTSTLLDVYVIKNSGSTNWDGSGVNKDQIVVKTVSVKLPSGTIVKATPCLYVEQKDPFSIDISSTAGSWAGLNTNTATFTFSVNLTYNKNIWVYYDISLPAGQGLLFVHNEFLQAKYTNYNAFPTVGDGIMLGSVVRGEITYSKDNRYQDLFNHPYNNIIDIVGTPTIFKEVSLVSQRKQISLQPLIQTTTTRDGTTRCVDTKTTDTTNKIVILPYPIQHLKGIYTAPVGGTELATQVKTNLPISNVDPTENTIFISDGYYIAELTSLKYDSSALFIGGEIELLDVAGGIYNPVYEHRNSSSYATVGSIVRLYDSAGVIYDVPAGSTSVNYRWWGRRIKVKGTGVYGFNINEKEVDCSLSDNNGLFSGFSDGQQLWIDMDYLGAPHNGSEIRTIYNYMPYQGLDVGGQEIKLIHRRDKGIFFNNGTGGGLIEQSISGTSNNKYTPISTKLPGSFNDYLRDGTLIEISSIGTKRFDSDFWMFASYDLYGYYGGGKIWADDFTMSSPEITSRGFLSAPVLEVIFELPSLDQTNAEFILPLIVVDKNTNELYMLVQIGNKGIHKAEEGDIYLELYRLSEKVLIK